VDLVNQFRAGEILDADQIRYLVDAGLVKMRGRMERTKPRVRLSPTKPRLRAGEPGKPRFRVIGQDTGKPRVRITGTAEGRPTVRFDLEGGKPRVSPGTMKPRVRITDSPGKPRLRPSPNKPRFRFVTDQGKPRLRLIDAAGETVRFVGDEDGAELSVLGREIVRALVNPTGRRKRLLREVQERGIGALRQRLRDDPDLQNEIDQLPRIISERSVDAGTVAAYMDAAQFRREVPATKDLPAEPVQPPARPDPENPAPRDPYGAEAEAQAREAGVTVDDIKQATDSLFNGMETCGV